MTETALKARPQFKEPAEPIAIRRFEMPDLTEHGPWISERLLKVYPSVTAVTLHGWLRGLLDSNEHLFLYQKNAVAVATTLHGNSLAPEPVVRERFVFVKDPKNQEQVEQAAMFYADFYRWAKAQGASAVILDGEMSDVPSEQARDKLGGRLFERKEIFAKVH